MFGVIGWIVFGLVVGVIAKLLMPGKDPGGFIITMLLGIAGAVVPCFVGLKTDRAFSVFWLLIGLLALAVSFLLVRRQAIKDAEPFWSLPTRRVAFALLPPFVVGLAAGIHVALRSDGVGAASTLAAAWVTAYAAEAVQVIEAPAARLLAGQETEMPAPASSASVTEMFETVTEPVLATRNE